MVNFRTTGLPCRVLATRRNKKALPVQPGKVMVGKQTPKLRDKLVPLNLVDTTSCLFDKYVPHFSQEKVLRPPQCSKNIRGIC